ncbi:hypothetical protein BHM03_00024948 [Ensete ventricosum]|nr:hypothetical protein BHM03_00024948 [Ensete ventricosum]
MTSLGSSIDVRSIPPARSGGTSLGSPVASTSGLSSGVPSLINAKSQRDLEVMKACHDIDLAMAEGSLDAIRKCYSIPDEYALRAPLPEQHPYNSSSAKLSISVDALEADLRFSFHPIIEKCLGWWRIFSKSGSGQLMALPNRIPWGIPRIGYHPRWGVEGYYLTARAEFKVSRAPTNNKGSLVVQVGGLNLTDLFIQLAMSPLTYPRRSPP